VSGVYGRHKACGEYHQFTQTCSVEVLAAAD
jgi:hypothetical protein